MEFSDNVTVNEAGLVATEFSSSSPDWTCSQKAGAGFDCRAKVKIAAGQSLPVFQVSNIFNPGIGDGKTIRNCATLKGAPSPSCATNTTPKAGETKQPQLTIKKKATVTECSDLGGHCDFEIEITKEGDAPFDGPLVINEEVKADGKIIPGTLSISPSAPWKCTQSGSPFTCTNEKPEFKDGKETLKVTFLLNSATGAKTIDNCANVVGDGATPCVSVPLIQGPKLVIAKEAVDGVCDPLCTFRITATNIGNAKLQGPIKIVDFPGDIKSDSGATDIKAEVVSVKTTDMRQDATCTKPGNILCTINRSLEPGGNVTIELTTKTSPYGFRRRQLYLERKRTGRHRAAGMRRHPWSAPQGAEPCHR